MNAPTKAGLIGPLIQLYFAEYLVVHKRVSSQTVASYRAIPFACCCSSCKTGQGLRRRIFR